MEKFLDTHPVFTFSEIYRYFQDRNTRNTVRQKVKILLKKQIIKQAKAGLYYVIPRGKDPGSYQPDYYLIASKLGYQSIIAYHSAFELHGVAHSNFQTIYFQDKSYHKPFNLNSVEFIGVELPKRTRALTDIFNTGIEKVDRKGLQINVSGLERTFIDRLPCPA